MSFDFINELVPAPNTHPDKTADYYESLHQDCKAQTAAAKEQLDRFETIVASLSAQRASLQQDLILAWDDGKRFNALSADYDRLSAAFEIAPLALAYYHERFHALSRTGTMLRKYRDLVMVRVREETALAERRKEQQAKQAVLMEERRAIQDMRDREREHQEAIRKARQDERDKQVSGYQDMLTDFLSSLKR